MTLAELKGLAVGERVRFEAQAAHEAGSVRRRDGALLEVLWPDGTTSVIWFRHCEDGREARLATLRRAE